MRERLFLERECEHGEYDNGHWVRDSHPHNTAADWCPGGSRREVVVDYEAAAAWFLDLVAKADEAGITLVGLATQTSHLIVPGILSRALGVEVRPPAPTIDEDEVRRIEKAIAAFNEEDNVGR